MKLAVLGLFANLAMGTNLPFMAGFNVLFGLLFVFIAVLIVVMLSYQTVLDRRAAKTASLRRNVREAVGRMVAGGDMANLPAKDVAALFSPKGLAELLHLMNSMTEEACKAMQMLLKNLKYESFISRQLEIEDADYLAKVARMVSAMNLTELDWRVSRLLYLYPNHIGVQYEALMALSRLGSTETLIQVCMDKNFAQCLSFRSLQEILGAYTGSKPQLYSYLLYAPDAYVSRTCLKLIGTFKITQLAHEVEDKLLEQKDYNLLADTIRCLGQLCHAPSVDKIAALANHTKWEVRAIVATCLGQIKPTTNAWLLAQMMQDEEWQVRYNAALALKHAGLLAQIEPQVKAGADAFAMDMLKYMQQIDPLWRANP